MKRLTRVLAGRDIIILVGEVDMYGLDGGIWFDRHNSWLEFLVTGDILCLIALGRGAAEGTASLAALESGEAGPGHKYVAHIDYIALAALAMVLEDILLPGANPEPGHTSCSTLHIFSTEGV